jgi:acetyl-CoA acetyltransferase family protein
MNKGATPFDRNVEIFDTTIGWRFVNRLMKEQYGIDSMPETAENVAAEFKVSRDDQDAYALRSQQRTALALVSGFFSQELIPVVIPQRKGGDLVVDGDEHPRPKTTLEGLAKLKSPFRAGGTVTAGNASGVNDGACALLLASADAAHRYQLEPKARVVAMATSGVEPRVMGMGPVEATRRVLALAGLTLEQMDVIELNEAFAAQVLAVLRELGLDDDEARVNPNGGGIALGHPLGMSGARLVTTAMYQLQKTRGRYALCTMCIGVGQGIALIIERV